MASFNSTPLVEHDLWLHNKRLRWALKFTEEELDENRLGGISPTQQEKLSQAKKRQRLLGSFVVGLFSVLILIALTERRGLTGSQLSSRTLDIVCGGPLILGGIAGILLALDAIVRRFQGPRKQAPKERVVTLTGPVYKQIYANKGRSYNLVIWGHSIRVSENEFDGFSEGVIYTLYQEESSGQILSAEAVNPALQENPNVVLQWAFEFGSKDLEENKQGVISDRQKRIFSGAPMGCGLILFVLTGLGLLSLSVISYWWMPLHIRILMLIVLAALIWADAAFVYERRLWQRGRVANVHGKVTLKNSTLIVDGKQRTILSIDGKPTAFISGGTYTIYYVPYNFFPFLMNYKPILSAEYHDTSTQDHNSL